MWDRNLGFFYNCFGKQVWKIAFENCFIIFYKIKVYKNLKYV